MLSQLCITNIAVIQKAEIGFEKGFNVFTGETGAGKSILIGAIGAVLGARTSKELIRTGENKASVSALFTALSLPVREKLAELGIETDGELLIERDITADSTACRINGKLSTVSMLKSIASLLIHIHGQQDSQILSAPETHLGFVDAFGELQAVIDDYRQSYDRLCEVKHALSKIETDDAAKARKIDLLQYQIDEIKAAELVIGEEEELLARKKLIKNAEHLTELLYGCKSRLDGDDEQQGAVSLIEQASEQLLQAAKYIENLSSAAKKAESFGYELEDISQQIREQLEMLEFDPNELNDIEERLDLISRLKKKYGGSIEEILAFCEEAEKQLDEISFSEQRIEKLKAELDLILRETEKKAEILTDLRKKAAEGFIKEVKAQLRDLDMPAAEMDIRFESCSLGENGADSAEFLLSVNPGEALKPLSKIASGGEMSRIMLGIKNVLTDKEDIATLIFDEVDTGISGRAAQKVGAKLNSAAKNRQVICVTHLAQVAAFGSHHLLIEKRVREGRTFTEIIPLDSDGRARELARIMNGEPITELALENARAMLAQKNI